VVLVFGKPGGEVAEYGRRVPATDAAPYVRPPVLPVQVMRSFKLFDLPSGLVQLCGISCGRRDVVPQTRVSSIDFDVAYG
jgi:hypothetical protein